MTFPTDEELNELMDSIDWQGYPNLWGRKVARAVLARWGRPTPQVTPETSDGYHTFAELYEHRHSLMLALMHSLPSLSWFSLRHADGELPFGDDKWFIVGIQLPTGPITYHLPIRLFDLARKTGAQELKTGRLWDGHTADEVVSCLLAWASSPTPQPADGEVAELAAWLRATAGSLHEGNIQTPRLARAADLLERLSPPQPPQGEVADCLADSLRSFKLTQDPADYPADHWSRRAANLLERPMLQPVQVSELLSGPGEVQA